MPQSQIALCITDLAVGGAERCLTELATRLDRTRFSPRVYCLAARPEPSQCSLVDRLVGQQIDVQFLGARGPKDFARSVRQLVKMLRQQRAQLVQTFLFHANIVCRIAAFRAGVPRVVSGIRVAQRAGGWRLWLDRMTDRLVDRHVCVSQAVADFAQRQGHLPDEKLVVIPNGVDLEQFSVAQPADLAPLGIRGGHPPIIFVGRLDHQKGLSWFLDISPQWLRRLPQCDLLLVGQGPLETSLRSQCQRLGIAERVHFAGWRPDISALLAASRLLVLPSAWEGMPNAVLEAMASRLPVVASDVEGVRELLGPGSPQQVAAFGDAEAFTARVIELAESPELAAQIGDQNHRRAVETFSFSRMVSAYQDLWGSLLAAQA